MIGKSYLETEKDREGVEAMSNLSIFLSVNSLPQLPHMEASPSRK